MFNSLMYSVLKFVISNLFTKEIVSYVIENVQFYFNDSSMSSDEKKDVVMSNLKEKAKEVQTTITTSGMNFLIEYALTHVKAMRK